ncbi:uncharacterized protein LOC100370800 [Saccoglossus kowalevskii]|uniref:Fatty acid amide hydrolase-like n=1 Tax=Saccoglossus kowalevskii TaxID=10224 RepID=A0ABM0GN65_SACKO|nr:PREDICTED: fatty acid amide hydrolase-like [Saccoglossus kowalevskii]
MIIKSISGGQSLRIKMSVFSILSALPVLGFTLWFLFFRRVTRTSPKPIVKREKGQPVYPIEYNLTSRESYPRVNGFALKIFAKVIHSFMGQAVLGPNAFVKNNYNLLRKIQYEDSAVYVPFEPFTGPEMSPEDGCPVDLEKFINAEETATEGFQFCTVSNYYKAYRTGGVSPMDVAEKAIKAIEDSEQLTPKLRAVVQYNVQEIKRMAKASCERFESNKPLSVFDGVPVLVKEEVHVVPYYKRDGSASIGNTQTKEDATMVKKLRDAGAVILGVTNMHEFGMGVTGINSSIIHGTARNPYNTDHCCGGSSAGSASAVGAGLSPVAIGTDAGGSIRIPASLCGVVGFKPTYGRVSLAGGCSDFSLLHHGPLACCVRDAALSYAIMAGPDKKDPTSLHQPIVSLDRFDDKSLTGLRVGIDWRFFRDTSTEILASCEKALLYIESLGAKVVDVQIPELEELRIAHLCVALSEMGTMNREEFNSCLHLMGGDTISSNGVGQLFTGSDFVQANQQRGRSMKFIREIFGKVDCIITPATGKTAVKIHPGDLKYGAVEESTLNNYIRYMFIGNMLGLPSLVLPIAYDTNGLPIALQLLGNWWQEDVVLRIGHATEGFLQKAKPQVHYSLLS